MLKVMTSVTTSLPLLLLVATFWTGSIQAVAECPCGYLDNSTNDLWTDAILTYFNETGASDDLVFFPSVSPNIQGKSTAGDTGSGSQDWSAVGNQVDVWEEAFGATYRSAVNYNNTILDDGKLRMAVNPAVMESRIVYGAEAVTRRRDILFGSFRTCLNATQGNGAGTAFQLSAMYNTSETIDLGLYMADLSNESTLQWSFSSRGTDANPVEVPISSLLGSSDDGFLEHRFDWKSDSILYSNNNTNISVSSLSIQKDEASSINIPSSPVPLSFRHWSNGDPIESEGPPHVVDHYGYVAYVRFFFNSSLPSRTEEFNQQCLAASNQTPCNVDDVTLRGSTHFSQLSTAAVPPLKYNRTTPTYSLYGITIAGGILVLLTIHGVVKIQVNKRHMRKAASSSETLDLISDSPTTPPAERGDSKIWDTMPFSQTSNSHKEDNPRLLYQNNERKESVTCLLSKWDPVAIAHAAQLDQDSDEEPEEGSDDDDFLMSRAEEENFAFPADDDALGRPDQILFLGPQASPSSLPSSTQLPRHSSSGYMTPSRLSQPTFGYVGATNGSQPFLSSNALLNHTRTSYNDNEGSWAPNERASLPPSKSSNTTNSSRRNSDMCFDPRRLSSNLSLLKLHRELLGDAPPLEISGIEESREHTGDISLSTSLTRQPNSWIADLDSQDNVDLDDESSIPTFLNPWSLTDGKEGHDTVPSSSFGHSDANHGPQFRRPSFASLSSFYYGPTTKSGNITPHSISVWTRRDPFKDGEDAIGPDGQPLASRIDPNRKSEKLSDAKDDDRNDTKPKKNIFKRINETLFVGPDATATTASGAARVGYLEGLRGCACFLVSFHHFMLIFWYAATTAGAPTHTNGFEFWFHRIFGALLLNQGLKIGIFFVLPARVMGTRYLLRGRTQDLADATLRRIPRLAFPTFGAVMINYFFIQIDAYKWVPRLASRTWSTWSYFQDYDSVGSFINSWISLWFTLPPRSPVLLSTYATGVLWTIPVITQSSFAILITVIISREIPNHIKRYSFYFMCIALSWYANRLDYYFIAGLVIADMDNKLKYRQAAERGIPIIPPSWNEKLPGKMRNLRVHGQIVGWILFLGGCLCQYLETLHLPGGQLTRWEHGILPDFTTAKPRVWVGNTTLEYWDPRGSLFCMVIGAFLLCDLCKAFSTFFMLRFWGAVGRNAFSLFLLHGTIFWTWGAWLCLQLLKVNCPYWATVTIVFVTSYSILAIFCELFTRTFDAWGVSVSKALWRYSSGSLERRD